ncbi:MAG: 2Fe-2S iron-sulfur cluster-binding protein, partial [Sulfolobales archaeon]
MSCFWACPYSARYVVEEEGRVELVDISVNGVRTRVPSGVTVARALEYLGYAFGEPSSKKPSLACKTGGCWSCAVIIDGSIERSCVTPVRSG